MTTTPTKTGIAIDLEELRGLMWKFVDEMTATEDVDEGNRIGMEWTFETFLQWLRKRRKSTNDHNILTFKIEKGAAHVPDDKRRV